MLLLQPIGTKVRMTMIIKTRIFQLCDGKYRNLSELAKDMGLSVSQVYRVREGKAVSIKNSLSGLKKSSPITGLMSFSIWTMICR